MTCPACGNPAAEPCAWGACPDCHVAHLCQPIERRVVSAKGYPEQMTYADATEVWTA